MPDRVRQASQAPFLPRMRLANTGQCRFQIIFTVILLRIQQLASFLSYNAYEFEATQADSTIYPSSTTISENAIEFSDLEVSDSTLAHGTTPTQNLMHSAMPQEDEQLDKAWPPLYTQNVPHSMSASETRSHDLKMTSVLPIQPAGSSRTEPVERLFSPIRSTMTEGSREAHTEITRLSNPPGENSPQAVQPSARQQFQPRGRASTLQKYEDHFKGHIREGHSTYSSVPSASDDEPDPADMSRPSQAAKSSRRETQPWGKASSVDLALIEPAVSVTVKCPTNSNTSNTQYFSSRMQALTSDLDYSGETDVFDLDTPHTSMSPPAPLIPTREGQLQLSRMNLRRSTGIEDQIAYLREQVSSWAKRPPPNWEDLIRWQEKAPPEKLRSLEDECMVPYREDSSNSKDEIKLYWGHPTGKSVNLLACWLARSGRSQEIGFPPRYRPLPRPSPHRTRL